MQCVFRVGSLEVFLCGLQMQCFFIFCAVPMWLKSRSQSILTHCLFVCLTISSMARNGKLSTGKSPAVPPSWKGRSTPFPPGGSSVLEARVFEDTQPVEDTQADPATQVFEDAQRLEHEQEEQDEQKLFGDTQEEQEACHPPNPQI